MGSYKGIKAGLALNATEPLASMIKSNPHIYGVTTGNDGHVISLYEANREFSAYVLVL